MLVYVDDAWGIGKIVARAGNNIVVRIGVRDYFS
jgi:hypothetical protein